MDVNRNFCSKRYANRLVHGLASDRFLKRYSDIDFVIDESLTGNTSGATYNQIRLNKRWFRMDKGRMMSDRTFVEMLYSYFHEARHMEQFREITRQPVFPNESVRNMTVVYVLSQAYPGYYHRNYYNNMCEIDADMSALTTTFSFVKNNFPNVPVEKYLLDNINEKSEWFDGLPKDKKLNERYMSLDDAVFALNKAFHRAYDQRVSCNLFSTSHMSPNLIKEINKHPGQIQTYESCETGRAQNEMLFQLLKQYQPSRVFAFPAFRHELSGCNLDIAQVETKRTKWGEIPVEYFSKELKTNRRLPKMPTDYKETSDFEFE